MLAIIGQSQSDSSVTWMQSQIHFIYCFYFICLWLPWVFVAARRLSPVAMSGDYSSLRRAGFSLPWLLLSQSMGSAVVAHRLRWPVLCGIFPEERSNPCSLHWRVDHRGSPMFVFNNNMSHLNCVIRSETVLWATATHYLISSSHQHSEVWKLWLFTFARWWNCGPVTQFANSRSSVQIWVWLHHFSNKYKLGTHSKSGIGNGQTVVYVCRMFIIQ